MAEGGDTGQIPPPLSDADEGDGQGEDWDLNHRMSRALTAADVALNIHNHLRTDSEDVAPPPLESEAERKSVASTGLKAEELRTDLKGVSDADFLDFLSEQNAAAEDPLFNYKPPEDEAVQGAPVALADLSEGDRKVSANSIPSTPAAAAEPPTPIKAPAENLKTPTESEVSSMYSQVFKTERLPGGGKSTRAEARVKMYTAAIEEDEIDMAKLRALAFQGIPDSKGLRATIWKLLLGYLPSQRRTWEGVQAQNKNLYKQYVSDVYHDPKDGKDEDALAADHPLNPAPKSEWTGFFEDQELMEEIEKDIRRTLPDLHFFNSSADGEGMTIHYEALRRMLFVYAKLNPATRYTQGMNEILAPLYYLFATVKAEGVDFEQAEVDAFFCFTLIMSDIRDLFTQIADKTDTGVHGWLQRLDQMLKERDLELWQHMESLSIPTQFYALRWLTLMLSQEFELPDVFRIWDSLFAYKDGFEFLLDICSAMLVQQHDALLESDFAGVMKLLQHYPPIDVNILVDKAQRLQGGLDIVEPVSAQSSRKGGPSLGFDMNKANQAVNKVNAGVRQSLSKAGDVLKPYLKKT